MRAALAFVLVAQLLVTLPGGLIRADVFDRVADAFGDAKEGVGRGLERARGAIEEGVANAAEDVERAYQDFSRGRGRAISDARRAAFKRSVAFSKRWNDEVNDATMRIGPFADMEDEEFTEQKTGLDGVSESEAEAAAGGGGQTSPDPNAPVPAEVDWVAAGKLSPILDQGSCGSCWAFASVCTMESASAIQTGVLRQLSVQQVVSCGSSSSGGGCSGDKVSQGFKFAIQYGGLTAQSAYPYQGVASACEEVDWKVVQIEDFSFVQPQSVDALKQAVAQGPVVVAISSSAAPVKNYAAGVLGSSGSGDAFAACCPRGKDCKDDVDHAVVVVGYSTQGNYWIIRNSWGTEWGDQGYMRLTMDATPAFPSGMCGVLRLPVRPVKTQGNTVTGQPPAGADSSIVSGPSNEGTASGSTGGGASSGAALQAAGPSLALAAAALLAAVFLP